MAAVDSVWTDIGTRVSIRTALSEKLRGPPSVRVASESEMIADDTLREIRDLRDLKRLVSSPATGAGSKTLAVPYNVKIIRFSGRSERRPGVPRRTRGRSRPE